MSGSSEPKAAMPKEAFRGLASVTRRASFFSGILPARVGQVFHGHRMLVPGPGGHAGLSAFHGNDVGPVSDVFDRVVRQTVNGVCQDLQEIFMMHGYDSCVLGFQVMATKQAKVMIIRA